MSMRSQPKEMALSEVREHEPLVAEWSVLPSTERSAVCGKDVPT